MVDEQQKMLDVYLQEYGKLKDEQAQRISPRHLHHDGRLARVQLRPLCLLLGRKILKGQVVVRGASGHLDGGAGWGRKDKENFALSPILND